MDESESSDDDVPLIKMIKKPPTEEQLKEAIKDLLKDANLEEVTMKQITRQVYDKYPDFDLTSRKEFIKETVKGLVSWSEENALFRTRVKVLKFPEKSAFFFFLEKVFSKIYIFTFDSKWSGWF